jgi:hypothetical protein
MQGRVRCAEVAQRLRTAGLAPELWKVARWPAAEAEAAAAASRQQRQRPGQEEQGEREGTSAAMWCVAEAEGGLGGRWARCAGGGPEAAAAAGAGLTPTQRQRARAFEALAARLVIRAQPDYERIMQAMREEEEEEEAEEEEAVAAFYMSDESAADDGAAGSTGGSDVGGGGGGGGRPSSGTSGAGAGGGIANLGGAAVPGIDMPAVRRALEARGGGGGAEGGRWPSQPPSPRRRVTPPHTPRSEAVLGERAFPHCVRPFGLGFACLHAACSCHKIREWKRPGQRPGTTAIATRWR